MRAKCTAGLLLLLAASSAGAAERKDKAGPLFPVPKVYRELGWTAELGPGATIVLGAKATEQERYAAARLQALIQRRFQIGVPVVAEGKPDAVRGLAILVGQRSTHALLDQYCTKRSLDLSPQSPGPDGFVIEVFGDANKTTVLLGGSDPRGVIYAQDAFFDLLERHGRKVQFPAVSLRDWPSIAWRGRPHSVLLQHLVPGALDAYVRARINFTDLRDDPRVKATNVFPARKASMGLPAGRPLDRPLLERMLSESHRRGMFVYGTVSCAVSKSGHEDVLKTFGELIAMGCDGLWISFDDTGAGQEAMELIGRVLDLGRPHQMTGRRVAVTPPVGDYQVIDRPFNRQAAKVPGFAEAEWFFTRVPCRADAEMARAIGLRRLPGWWHNLVNIDGGFLHNGDILVSLRADDRPGYVNLQPLSSGWGRPDYRAIRDAAEHTDHVLLWGVVGGWPEEYQVGALGLWAWNPAAHDWPAMRRAIYRYVYGPGQVEAAWAFDDQLAALKALFQLPVWYYEPNKGWPCRLKRVEDRPKALALIEELKVIQATIAKGAMEESALDRQRLESVYLEPMRTTLVYARKMAQLDYPEAVFAPVERQILDRIDQGKLDEARQLVAEREPVVRKQLDSIAAELKGLKAIDGYAAYWQKRVSGLESWKQDAARRRAKKPAPRAS